jgi:glycosyltransferase involved in cell wall biosynthesis
MKISVAMCTYNGERFLKEQIDSILAQTVSVQEIVICDDGSNDKTLEILQEYFNQFPTIFRIYQNENTLKSVKNFEKAISLCTGEITFLCDQDDYWYPEKVKTTIQYFTDHETCTVLCSNGIAIDEHSNEIKNRFIIWDVFARFIEETSNYTFFNFLTQKGNFATGATMAFKSSIKPIILPIPEIKDFHHDEYIALVASATDSIHFINKKLIKYRIHESQQVGGIAFLMSEHKFEDILHYFKWKSNTKETDLKTLKSRIKSQIEWYNTYFPFYKKKINAVALELISDCFFRALNNNVEKIKELYPLKYKILALTDKILGKRQLRK